MINTYGVFILTLPIVCDSFSLLRTHSLSTYIYTRAAVSSQHPKPISKQGYSLAYCCFCVRLLIMVKSTSSTYTTFVRQSSTDASASASASASKYKGVNKRKWGKFVSEIRLPNSRERIWLGSYDTAAKAARAFDAALFCLRGRNVKFNFPENPPEITKAGMSMTPGEIQEAAARYAHSGDQGPRAAVRVENSNSLSSSSSELMPSSHAESPCPSVSYETALPDKEFANIPLDNAFLDQFLAMGHENNVHDFGVFPPYGDFSGEFFVPPLPNVDCWPDIIHTEEISSESSFLWNF